MVTIVSCDNGPPTSSAIPIQPETTTALPPNSEQQGAAFSISTDAFYQGTYEASASQGQIISLSLSPDRKAQLVTNNLDNSQGTIDAGVWNTASNGNLELRLKRVGGKDTTRLEFKTDGEQLVYTGTEYGDKGLILSVKPVPK